jgi:predicted DNA-binding transcriptional regulator AlpA
VNDREPSKIVRIIEIAELLSLTHQRASKILDEPGLPTPVGRERQSRLWDLREVTAWVKRSGAARSPR